MHPTNPLYSKLIYQLAPAALVTGLGIVLLSSLARPVSAPQQQGQSAPTAVQSEAVFTPTPKPAQVAERTPAPAAPKAKPPVRKVATVELPPPPQRQPMTLAAAPIAQPMPQPLSPQAAPTPAPTQNRTVVGRLWGVTTTVASIPHRAYSKVSGWFAYDAPPRPPADVPAQNFKATM